MGRELLYGHWGYVLFYSVAWSLVIFVLIRPRKLRELGVYALFTLFLIDAFTELYGVPFSINLITDWLGLSPQTDLFSRRSGELWRMVFRQPENPEGFDPYYLGGGVLIFGGLGLLYYASRVLKAAQASGLPAVTGPYAWGRHPQYLALIAIMLGLVISNPTLLILMLFPLITYLYVRLAHHEEEEALIQFGPAYAQYVKRTPRFVP